ncbi:hypothetical protein MTR_0007s0250 [Medicago truncatula]|uniref:No apical meristem-associated C-terminal domain-containing protein n=1 Tax=Medicago truncatula TaxID=3880 RepID=A0A072TJG6_MEDTR|nr:hypothetical protein MTR_0007s0250 [Medicago truncatula]
MTYPSQTPPFNAYMPMGNKNVPSIGAPEFPQFSTQITLGGMTGANEVTPNSEDSTPNRKKNQKLEIRWTTEQNLETAKKKGKKKSKEDFLELVDDKWAEFKQFKEKELEQLDKIALIQQEANQLMKESTHAKKMKMYIKLSSEEHFDDRKKKLLEKLGQELFGN